MHIFLPSLYAIAILANGFLCGSPETPTLTSGTDLPKLETRFHLNIADFDQNLAHDLCLISLSGPDQTQPSRIYATREYVQRCFPGMFTGNTCSSNPSSITFPSSVSAPSERDIIPPYITRNDKFFASLNKNATKHLPHLVTNPESFILHPDQKHAQCEAAAFSVLAQKAQTIINNVFYWYFLHNINIYKKNDVYHLHWNPKHYPFMVTLTALNGKQTRRYATAQYVRTWLPYLQKEEDKFQLIGKNNKPCKITISDAQDASSCNASYASTPPPPLMHIADNENNSPHYNCIDPDDYPEYDTRERTAKRRATALAEKQKKYDQDQTKPPKAIKTYEEVHQKGEFNFRTHESHSLRRAHKTARTFAAMMNHASNNSKRTQKKHTKLSKNTSKKTDHWNDHHQISLTPNVQHQRKNNSSPSADNSAKAMKPSEDSTMSIIRHVLPVAIIREMLLPTTSGHHYPSIVPQWDGMEKI